MIVNLKNNNMTRLNDFIWQSSVNESQKRVPCSLDIFVVTWPLIVCPILRVQNTIRHSGICLFQVTWNVRPRKVYELYRQGTFVRISRKLSPLSSFCFGSLLVPQQPTQYYLCPSELFFVKYIYYNTCDEICFVFHIKLGEMVKHPNQCFRDRLLSDKFRADGCPLYVR